MGLVASDVMESEVLTVGVDWTIRQATELFLGSAVTGAPVLDEEGALKGIVSYTDIAENQRDEVDQDETARVPAYFTGDDAVALGQMDLKSLHLSIDPLATVGDIMTERVYTVSPQTPIQEIADAMVRGRFHRVLVTDEAKLCGIITTLDLLEVLCAVPARVLDDVRPPKEVD